MIPEAPRRETNERLASPPLLPGRVHVWEVDLGPALDGRVEGGFLSAEESARAARFHRPADRARSVAARSALRALLGGYLGQPPAALRFVAGAHGKPALAPRSGAAAPAFNVAHSGRLVLLAFASGDVGIDVEEIRADVRVDALARRCFSEDERSAMAAAPPPERERVFFRIWTRKEAFLKARGTGLSSSLSEFSTTAASGAPLESVRASSRFPTGFLYDLEVADGYAGAVVTSEPARVERLSLPTSVP